MSNKEYAVAVDDSETEPEIFSDMVGLEPLPSPKKGKGVVFDDSETEPEIFSDMVGLEPLPEKKESSPKLSFKMEDLVKRIVEASEARRRKKEMAADAAPSKRKESLPPNSREEQSSKRPRVDDDFAELITEIQALKQACLESKVFHHAILIESRCTSITCMRGFDNVTKLLEKIEKKL